MQLKTLLPYMEGIVTLRKTTEIWDKEDMSMCSVSVKLYAPVPADYPAAVQNAMQARAPKPAPAPDLVTNKRDAVGMSERVFAQFLTSQKDFVTTILDRVKTDNVPWRKLHTSKLKHWRPKTQTGPLIREGNAEGGISKASASANIVTENAKPIPDDKSNGTYQVDDGPVIAVDEGDTDPWQPDEDNQMQG
ncbi:hypothetical protein BD410DRAFT_802402 [Rickenella mellea]|uniref:Uncharacterized protein n=1 Tax=Rickenella mellea TaxID=50990 RepID=A0A4Y7Q8B9_9AGAM|nr:hypothetical protein BD410DRAFT_802402 [Rickenella mellea]